MADRTAKREAGSQAGNGRRVRQNSKRTQEVIDAATEIFRRQGYADTSVQDIADGLGILKGSLYYYIDTKEDLLFNVLADVHAGALVFIDEVRQAEGTPLERLSLYVQRHVEYNAENFAKVVVYYHDFDRLSAPRRKTLTKERSNWQRLVADLLNEAKDAGEISADLDVPLATNFIFGAANWVYTWYQPRGGASPQELGQLWADLLIKGLAGAGRD